MYPPKPSKIVIRVRRRFQGTVIDQSTGLGVPDIRVFFKNYSNGLPLETPTPVGTKDNGYFFSEFTSFINVEARVRFFDPLGRYLPAYGGTENGTDDFCLGAVYDQALSMQIALTPADVNPQSIQPIIDAIYTLYDTPTLPISDKARDDLIKAQDKLEEVLDKLAEGDVKKGLKKLSDAVKALLKAQDEGGDVVDLVSRLVQMGRTQAQNEIDQAIEDDGDWQEIEKAQRSWPRRKKSWPKASRIKPSITLPKPGIMLKRHRDLGRTAVSDPALMKDPASAGFFFDA